MQVKSWWSGIHCTARIMGVLRYAARSENHEPSLHFSPPDGRSTRYEHQDFVALACRAQRTVQVRLRAPSGSRLFPPPGLRLVLPALSRTSPRHVVRKAG